MLAAYLQYWKINLLTMAEYRADFFMWLGFTIVYHGTALAALAVTMMRFPSMNGWSLREMFFLYALWMAAHERPQLRPASAEESGSTPPPANAPQAVPAASANRSQGRDNNPNRSSRGTRRGRRGGRRRRHYEKGQEAGTRTAAPEEKRQDNRTDTIPDFQGTPPPQLPAVPVTTNLIEPVPTHAFQPEHADTPHPDRTIPLYRAREQGDASVTGTNESTPDMQTSGEPRSK